MTGVPADAGALWRSGADIESLFKFMREGGFNQAQSTEALESVTGFEASKAQIAVARPISARRGTGNSLML